MKKLLPLAIIVVVALGFYYLSMDKVTWKTVTSSTLNLSFMYPVHSKQAADPLKGTVSFTIAYDHVPTNPRDWMVTTDAKKAVLATMKCDPIRGSGAYLPVDTDKPMQCGVVKSPSGLVSVYMVGVGRPDNGTAYPESLILTLKDNEVAALAKVAKFTATEKIANEAVTTFTHVHPQAVIWPPDENAKKLYSDVDDIVIAAVSKPVQEVVDGLALLRRIAETAATTK